MKKLLATILIISVFFWNTQSVFAATTVDLFNSDTKTTGDLNGQDGWSGSVLFDVQNTVVQEGDQAVSKYDPTTTTVIDLAVTPQTAAIFSSYHRKTNTTTYGDYIRLRDDGVNICAVYLSSDAHFWVVASAPELDTGVTYAANTWYQVEIEVDQANDQCRVRIDGGTWTAWKGTTGFADIDTVRFQGDNQDDTMYWDNLTYTPVTTEVAVETTQLPILFGW